jgi:hypothetical protein
MQVGTMINHCRHCGTLTAKVDEICTRPQCREKELERQTALKCRDLGIGQFRHLIHAAE